MIIDYLVLRLLRDARNGIFNRFLDCARNDKGRDCRVASLLAMTGRNIEYRTRNDECRSEILRCARNDPIRVDDSL